MTQTRQGHHLAFGSRQTSAMVSEFSHEAAREIFVQFGRKARELGIGKEKLSQMHSVRLLQSLALPKSKVLKRNDKTKGRQRPVVLAAILGAILAASFAYRFQLYTWNGFANLWLTCKRRDVHSEQCLIDMPSIAQDIFRPIVNCNVCKDIDRVESVENIDPEDFKFKYAYTGKPVVIADGALTWPALTMFRWDYFRRLYAPDSPALDHFRFSCQFFPYKTEFKSLRQVFNMSDTRHAQPWYVGWSNCDSTVANELRRHYSRPYFLPIDSETTKTDWIFMGSPGYGAHLHIDHVGNPSWQAQIIGHKHWTLVPPPECTHICQKLEVTVQPGQIIVLDTNLWFHKTIIVGEEMSVTIGSEYD